jgi:hypothetical protein
MKIALVSCPYDGAKRIPLGALVLKGSLAALGHDVDVFNFSQDYDSEQHLAALNQIYGPFPGFPEANRSPLANVHCWEDTLIRSYLAGGDLPQTLVPYVEEVLTHEPRLVGFSVQNSFEAHNPLFLGQLLFSLGMALAIKKVDTKITVVFGGSALYSAEQNREIMASFPFIDALVSGEGELPLQMIVSRLNGEQKDLTGIPGILWRNGQHLEENKGAPPRDLPFLAPDYRGFDLNPYRRAEELVLPLELSRGCPWGKCTYCSFPLQGAYRTKPDSVVERELGRYLSDRLANLFFIVDNAVTAHAAIRFADLVLSSGWEISYALLARPTASFTTSVLEKLVSSGCRIILWGGETFSPRMISAIRKGTRVDEVAALLERSHGSGIFNYLFYIFGLPEQSIQDLDQDKAFLQEHADKITAVLPNYFRLDRESDYFRKLYGADPDRLIPIFSGDSGKVHSLLCKAEQDQAVFDYIREHLANTVKQSFISADERDLLRILKQNTHVTVDNVKSIADLNSLLDHPDARTEEPS